MNTIRVLLSSDPFCPQCGHNRDKSSVSSIDEGDSIRSCQMCGATWREVEPDSNAGVGACGAAKCSRGCADPLNCAWPMQRKLQRHAESADGVADGDVPCGMCSGTGKAPPGVGEVPHG